MGLKLPRMRLRTRVVVTIVAAAVLAACSGSLAVAFSARTVILESQQENFFADFSASSEALVRNLSADPTAEELEFVAEESTFPAVLVDGATGVSSDSAALTAMPGSLRDASGLPSQAVTYLRRDVRGAPSFTIARLIERDDVAGAAPIGVFITYPLDAQYAQVDRFFQLALITGGVVAVAATAMGLVFARHLNRPLRRLEHAVASIGDDSAPPESAGEIRSTGDRDFDVVLDALRATSRRLETTMTDLRRSEDDSRRLVADVAHELRTPLASMVAVSEIAEDDEAGDDKAEAVGILARNTRHLARLTEQILELSRNDAGTSRVEVTEVDVTELLREVAQLNDWPATVAVDADAPGSVRTDRTRLSLIVTNLVANALRHGAPPVRVSVRSEGDQLEIEVGDRGPGVPPEHQHRIFDRFYKSGTDRARSVSSGLGLAIVRENARLLGGDATYRRRGDETVFRVWTAATARSPNPGE